MAYNNITDHYDDATDYMDEIIAPTYYPEGTATLDKKWVKLWLSPDLNAMDDGGLNFAPQFWGDTAYGIILNHYIGYTNGVLPDAISLSQFKALTADRRNEATNWGEKLNLARTYATYAPAVIGYDPVHDGFFGTLATAIGGTTSVSNFERDSALDIINGIMELHLSTPTGTVQSFYYDAAGYDPLDPDRTKYMAYTVPPCFLDVLNPSQKSADLNVFFVISYLYPDDTPLSRQRYIAKWVIYSESVGYYQIEVAIPTFGGLNLPYGEPTNEPDEGDEPDVPIPIPALPTLDISSAGVRLFKAGNFNALINYMWGNGSIFDAINKLIGDQTPYECIVAMNLFPYGEALYTGANANIQIGNIDTYVSAPTTNQFASIDFGTATIPRRFNNALDFAPYTIVELFLPFIGRVKLPTDFVMGKTIGVTYHMDCLTGGCFAFITTNVDGVIQCEGGSCLIQLPLSAQTANGARQAISSAMSAGVSFAVGSGMSSTITSNMKSAERLTAGAGVVGSIGNGIQNTLNALSAKDSYTTFGGISLANGYLGLSNPVLYIHRPIDATPSGYNNIMGYAASTIQNLGSLSGFTQVKEINLGVAGASREDLDEIEALLKEGVIL